jgi:DNA polymerase-3 subunit delta'
MSDADTLASAWVALPPWLSDVAAIALSRRDRWPHALLLNGRRGLGKRALALHFARSLLCESPLPDGSACAACPSCGYVVNGTHPDLRIIEPVVFDNDGNATAVDVIQVDRIRDLIEFTQLSTHRLGAKVAVIVPAEAMNLAAANALLKTLEEPPAGTFLILVSHQPARLPATIRSRCRVLAVPEPAQSLATEWLSAQGVDRAQLILAQAGGAPFLAASLADPSIQRDRDRFLSELARPGKLSPVGFGARIDATPKDERKPALGHAVYWLMTWTADLAAVASGGQPRFHPDHAAALTRLASRLAPVPLFRYYQTLLRQRALLPHPLQPRLVAEALLFDYRNLFPRGLD